LRISDTGRVKARSIRVAFILCNIRSE
jgi:hypothetical protein